MIKHDFVRMRRSMVESQLRTSGVNDPAILAVMVDVPRERFVAAGQEPVAYLDRALPLGGSRALSPPLALGLLLTAADPQPTDNALLIGAGTGYAAAVLARLVASVTAVESDSDLAQRAQVELADIPTITLVEGLLNAGAPDHAPYDLIVIDGAVEAVPPAIIAQLIVGGRLVTGIDDHNVTRLAAGVRTGGGFGLRNFADSEIPVLPGFQRARGFAF